MGGADCLMKARNCIARALAIGEKARGQEHPSVAIDLWNLAGVLVAIGGADNIARARENLVRAEAIFRKVLGDEHPRAQRCAASLAAFREKYGDG
jgi:hypothetical protein